MVEKKDTKEIVVPEVNESDKIWSEIKDLPIEMFSLPDQMVKQHVQRMRVSTNEVYLKLKSTAVIASLENSLAMVRGRKYVVEVSEGYVLVKRGVMPIQLPKPEPTEK